MIWGVDLGTIILVWQYQPRHVTRISDSASGQSADFTSHDHNLDGPGPAS